MSVNTLLAIIVVAMLSSVSLMAVSENIGAAMVANCKLTAGSK